jgi:carbonic anhydrase
MFTSTLATQIFGAATEFEGQQFHFHAGSEHTVDGKRFDLEMHTVHYPKAGNKANGFIAAAMGIIFSVEEYTANLTWSEQRIVDTFFDSLQWDDLTETGPTVDLITYGNLMELVDNKNRWIYKGSVTTPPCATYVYWNVLSTIYPISAKHLQMFKNQLNRGEDGKLDEYGNWRLIQKVDEHNVIYLKTGEEVDKQYRGLVAGVIILAIVAFLALVVAAVLGAKVKKMGEKSDGGVEMKSEA